jgi:glycosyltransferase involved in cell wall biosynthesis
MHTPIYKGDFNIEELLKNYPELKKHVYLKNTQNKISPDTMNYIYQISDIHVNVSHQEGLSWTPIEAMLCGVPCILSESTAHFDYLYDDCTFAVKQDEMDFIMQHTESGPALLECGACSPSAIKKQLVHAYDVHQKDPNAYAHMTYAAELRANVWVNDVHDINNILTTTYSKNKEMGFVI